MPERAAVTVRRLLLVASCLLLLAGAGLIGVNVFGALFKPGLPDGIPKRAQPPGGVSDELLEGSLVRRRGEPERAYAQRLVLSVHYRVSHGWRGDESGVPFREKFYLWAKGRFGSSKPNYAKPIELVEHEHALRRGYGLCSQFALILDDVLGDQGISGRIVSLDRHVVAAATFESGREMILDADFGVVVPHTMREVERNPRLVDPHYSRVPSTPTSPYTSTPLDRRQMLELMHDVYRPPNQSFASAEEYSSGAAWVERDGYRKKWQIPIALLLAGAAGMAIRVAQLPARNTPPRSDG